MTEHAPSYAHRNGRTHIGVIIGVTMCAVIVLALAAGLAILPRGDRIARGISVFGVDLGGMTEMEARERIDTAFTRAIDQSITFVAGDERRTISLSELGIRGNADATLSEAVAVGRQGSLIHRVVSAARARSGLALTHTFSFNEGQARDVLEALGTEINHPAVDAAAHWDQVTETVAITPEQQGQKLDIPASLEEIKANVFPNLTHGEALPTELDLPYRVKVPRITAALLAPVDTMLGEYTTSFATSARGRASNVETAARSINGTMLLPDAQFSFNDTVGPRNSANGFKQAPVIINGQLKPGIGGGICQVSTTLYNAVLLSNLKIVSRSHHSLPIHYAPPGRDATVAYGAIDFRFQNSSTDPIVIETAVEHRRLTVRILGKGPAPVVRIVRSNIFSLPGRTITKKDPSLPSGTRVVDNKGTPGLAVTVTRIAGDGPNAVREELSRDKYLGEPTIIRIGTGAAAASATVESVLSPETATP